MTPVWLRLLVFGFGAVLFFGSWFVGNTVDAQRIPTTAERMPMLQKDAITFLMRIVGSFIAVAGLLLWVIAAGRSGVG